MRILRTIAMVGDVANEELTLYGTLAITFCARNTLLYSNNRQKYAERDERAISYAMLRYQCPQFEI